MKNNSKAFTLVELVVAIAITALIALGINNISLNKISESQKVGIYYNKIRSNIETAINNSLIGKSVDSNLNVPKYWKINIKSTPKTSTTGTGEMIISYGSGIFQTSTGLTIKSPIFYSITNIKCNNLAHNNESLENEINLLVEKGNLSLSGCTYTDSKIIDFDIMYKNYKKHININSVTNVIN